MRDTTDDDITGAAGGGPTSAGERRSRAARLRAIEEVAWRQFAAGEYEAVGLAEIAAEVGLARSTVQTYVGSKRDLYRQCVDRAVAELDAHLAMAAGGDGNHADRLRRALAAFLDFADERPEAWALVDRHLFVAAGPFAADGARMREQLLPRLEELVAGARVPSSPGATASAVLGSLHALASWRSERPDIPRESVVERATALIWFGLALELGR
ncbi:MAG: TetR/AcrR family transcriptional regulator [Thermoleophilaceae bacterium]